VGGVLIYIYIYIHIYIIPYIYVYNNIYYMLHPWVRLPQLYIYPPHPPTHIYVQTFADICSCNPPKTYPYTTYDIHTYIYTHTPRQTYPRLKSSMACAVLKAESGYHTWPAWGSNDSLDSGLAGSAGIRCSTRRVSTEMMPIGIPPSLARPGRGRRRADE